MGRKGSARGPSAGRCFLVGPFRSDARIDASLCREAFSPSLVRMHIGLPALQLRFLATPCLAGACAAALAAGWRALAKPSSILAALALKPSLGPAGWPPSLALALHALLSLVLEAELEDITSLELKIAQCSIGLLTSLLRLPSLPWHQLWEQK